MLEKIDYQNALRSQSGCNLSGIVHTFSETLPKIWADAREQGKGTEWVNTHPICVLFAEQIKHLAGDDYSEAYKICTEKGEA